MHESSGATGLLVPPEEPEPAARPARRPRRRKGFLVALAAGVMVLLCANGAMAYFGHQISLDEPAGSVERTR